MSTSSPEGQRGASLVPGGGVEEGYVVLPYTKEEFKDFITSLLGSPQAISKNLFGGFEVSPDDIRNLHQLIKQRIVQQNEAVLARFTARVLFSDDSTVELSSLEELLTYNEVRPITSEALHARWDWLVKFQDKQAPEKQSIQVSFVSSDGQPGYRIRGPFFIEDSIPIGSGAIGFRIEHTARTWGADIEALLSAHFKNLLQHETKLRAFFHRHSGVIAVATTAAFVSGSLAGAFVATRTFSMVRLREANTLLATTGGTDLPSLNLKLAQLGQLLAGGAWAQYYFGLAVFLFVSLLIALGLAVWLETTLDVREPSFVLFTKESYKHRERVKERLRKKWRSFLIALLTSVATGVVGNLVFRAFFE